MDRRKQQRSRCDLSAAIRVLDADTQIEARVLDLSQEGLAIFSPIRLRAGAPVSVNCRGILILAEIVYCISHGAGYRAGLTVDQALATIAAQLSVPELTRELLVRHQESLAQELREVGRDLRGNGATFHDPDSAGAPDRFQEAC